MSITYTNGSDNIKNGSGTAVCRAQLGWEKTAETNTSVTYSCKVYIYCIRYGYTTSRTLSASLGATGKSADATMGGSCSLDAGERKQLISKSYTFTKTTSSQSIVIDFQVTSNGTSVSGKSSGTKKITIPALASYSISYNGNGATSGSMSAQTKYYGKSLTLRSNAFSRTGYNFSKFNTNASGTGTNYSSGGTYTANAKATLYAQWTPQTHTITYYGNGATSGSTYTQTKTYGQTATLYNNFTRDGYSITGWNTAANGSGTAYSTTQVLSATFNSNLTLYAQWKLNYTKATISNLIVQRVESNGDTAEYDQGTVLYVYFDSKTGTSDQWETLDTLYFTIETYDKDGEVIEGWNGNIPLNQTAPHRGEGQPYSTWLLNNNNGYDTALSYKVVITLTSNNQSVSKTITISPSTFPIDLLVGSNDDVYMGVMHPAQTGIPLITAPLTVDGNISIPNNLAYKSKNSSGNERSLCLINNYNNYLYGYDSYVNNEGGSYLYGNTINIRSKGAINIGQAADNNTIAITGATSITGGLNITGQYQRHGNTYIITDSRSKDNVRVPGTSSSDNSYVTITVDHIEENGYSPIAVVNYNFQNATTNGANSSHIMCYGCSFDTSVSNNNTASVKVRNLNSADAKIKVTLRILYRAV